MAENGEEKLLSVARHIAKTLGRDDAMADDILQIFSNFDGRFSRDKFSDKDKARDDRSRTCTALEHSINSFHRQISQYVAADHPIWADSADSSAFLDTIDELISIIRDWAPMSGESKTISACLSRAEDLLHQAMFRVEDEFRSLMERGGESFELSRANGNGDSAANMGFDSEDEDDDDDDDGDVDRLPTARPITDYDIIIDALPSGTVNNLHEMAKRMVIGGFGKECSHVYSSCRRDFLEESMSRLGLRKLSIEEVQKMAWQDLEDEIEKWTKAANVALRILFPSERRLCDRVFFRLSSASDLSFMETCRGSTIQLLNFADSIAIGSRSPERLFKILDLFETLRDLLREFESLFSDQYCILLRNEAINIWKRLGEAIRGIFMELENLISRDPVKTPVPGGGLHPITRYVMNYLRAACRSRRTLEQIFEESAAAVPSKEYGVGKLDEQGSSSSLSIQMAWVMELLESNLEAKSRVYKDPAFCSVFLMNNGRYIVEKVKDNELGVLLGDDWIRKHIAKARQYQVNYQRSSWNRVLGVLKVDDASSVKEKLKLFIQYFEEICKSQSTWVIFDDQLREDLRISVAKNLLPAYQSFLGRFRNHPEVGKNAERYIKYGPQDIGARIGELFKGGGGSAIVKN